MELFLCKYSLLHSVETLADISEPQVTQLEHILKLLKGCK